MVRKEKSAVPFRLSPDLLNFLFPITLKMQIPKSFRELYPTLGNELSPEMEEIFEQIRKRQRIKEIGFWIGIVFAAAALVLTVYSIRLTKQYNDQKGTIEGLQQQIIQKDQLIDQQQSQINYFQDQLMIITSEKDTTK